MILASRNTKVLTGLFCSVFLLCGMNFSQWAHRAEPIALQNLIKNISYPGTVKGSVIASPSQHRPNYFYFWIRDASLVMTEVAERYARESQSDLKERYFEM